MKKRYNIRNLRKLNSLKPRHFAYDEDEGGDTLANKLNTINHELFGDLNVFTLDEKGADEAIKFFLNRVANREGEEEAEIWKHLARVIGYYLYGDTNKKPPSLAVSEPCKELQNYRYDYYTNMKNWVKADLESIFKYAIIPDGKLQEFGEMSIKELENYFYQGYKRDMDSWVDDYGVPNSDEEFHGDTRLAVLSYLAGNAQRINEVLKNRRKTPEDVDTEIRLRCVKYCIGEILINIVRGYGFEPIF